jgi:hypothetical protein
MTAEEVGNVPVVVNFLSENIPQEHQLCMKAVFIARRFWPLRRNLLPSAVPRDYPVSDMRYLSATPSLVADSIEKIP